MANNPSAQQPADGSQAATPANKNGVNPQQQGTHEQTKPQTSDDDSNASGTTGNPNAKGSSHRGAMPNAESENTGGGSDKEHKNQPKNTTEEKNDYGTGNAAPSAANDGGKIGDANNPV
jgi:hypothetical protein